jgi:signal transduction histidine kinase
MKKIFQKLIIRLRRYLPLSRELRNEYKRIILTIQMVSIGGIASLLSAFIDLQRAHYVNLIQDISTVVFFVFVLYIITKGKFSQGKFLAIIYSCITLTILSSREGRHVGNEFLWFPIFGGIFLFFSAREKVYIIVSFIVAISSLFFLEYTDYSYMRYPGIVVGYTYLNYLLSLVISIGMVCLYMYYLIKVNTDSERKLERLNHTLIQRNENLRKTNAELDSFVYKASHDMRAPLTSLLGLIEISKKETDPSTLTKFLDLQEKSIKKLDGYIVDILNISRNARMEVVNTPINFREMIEHIFDQLYYMDNCFHVKKNIVVYQIVSFISDPIRLNIILSNIISNSIRYADLSKPEPFISITVKTTIDDVEITIKDNGTGISEEHLGKVFNMFYRATEINNGSGLGLYIVKETLQKIRGTINIKSEYRKYTEIIITIPNHIEPVTKT